MSLELPLLAGDLALSGPLVDLLFPLFIYPFIHLFGGFVCSGNPGWAGEAVGVTDEQEQRELTDVGPSGTHWTRPFMFVYVSTFSKMKS